MKFGELRKYISQIDRISICMKETLRYENYCWISQVPERYDDYEVYGIGQIVSEFKRSEAVESEIRGKEVGQDEFLAPCIEIMLSKNPRFQMEE